MRRELKSTLTYFLVLLFSTFSFPSKVSFFLKIFTFLKSFIFLPLPQFSRLTPTMPSVAPAPACPEPGLEISTNFTSYYISHFTFYSILPKNYSSPSKSLLLQVLQSLLHSSIPPHILLQISFNFLALFWANFTGISFGLHFNENVSDLMCFMQ